MQCFPARYTSEAILQPIGIQATEVTNIIRTSATSEKLTAFSIASPTGVCRGSSRRGRCRAPIPDVCAKLHQTRCIIGDLGIAPLKTFFLVDVVHGFLDCLCELSSVVPCMLGLASSDLPVFMISGASVTEVLFEGAMCGHESCWFVHEELSSGISKIMLAHVCPEEHDPRVQLPLHQQSILPSNAGVRILGNGMSTTLQLYAKDLTDNFQEDPLPVPQPLQLLLLR